MSILPVADIVFPVASLHFGFASKLLDPVLIGLGSAMKAVFVVELVIRLGAERWNFFDGEEKWWSHGKQ